MCQFIHKGPFMWQLPMMHWTSLYRLLGPPTPSDLETPALSPSPPPPPIPNLGLMSTSPTPAIYDHWRPVQTCYFGGPYGSNIWWWPQKPKDVQSPSLWHVSNWNTVFLFTFKGTDYFINEKSTRLFVKGFLTIRFGNLVLKSCLASLFGLCQN